MAEWEFCSSSHIVFIDSDSLKAQSERLGEGTETEVSDTVLDLLCVLRLVNKYSENVLVCCTAVQKPTNGHEHVLLGGGKKVKLNENCTIACQKM